MQTRRSIVTQALFLPAATGMSVSAAAQDAGQNGIGRILVAYFSRSGNTRVIAGQIRRVLHTDLVEIEPAQAYPEDYFETVEQARHERDGDIEPPLKARVAAMMGYTTLFLGFPIWGETAPPVIRAFLSAHDLRDKTVIPFITHGGFGLGNSLSVLRTHAPQARFVEAFSMQAPQERQTIARVTDWMSGLANLN